VVVVGLGPGDPGLITTAALTAIDATPVRFLRTGRHPSAPVVAGAVTFDDVYERADSFEEVYATVVATLLEAARRHREVLYAVPGSPLVAERTVELLRAQPDVVVEIHPALSFVDLAWDRLGVDPFALGVRLVDGHRFALDAAGQTGPLLVAQCDRPQVLSDIKLAVDGDPGPVVVLQRLGLPDEAVTKVAWADLDRDVHPDHLTCLWIPQLAEPVAAEVVRLVELVEVLRLRCPWDRDQTHASLARHLLEESYEVLDAIAGLPAGAGALADAGVPVDSGVDIDPAWEHLEEELGDLLFQVVFHARLGREAGRFGLADVARGVHDKLVDRHPHVFGDAGSTTIEDLTVSWEQRKKREKGRASVTDGIPATLPALAYAEKVQRKAASLGLDWPDTAGVWAKVDEELAELRQAVAGADAAGVVAEIGDVLFSVVNLGRKLGVEAEASMRAAAMRFKGRVAYVEQQAAAAGVEPAAAGAARLDGWWEEAKTNHRAGS
jgi:tetrapyrrole methylase family protein/MazG family protein